jgi:hypothetical protein
LREPLRVPARGGAAVGLPNLCHLRCAMATRSCLVAAIDPGLTSGGIAAVRSQGGEQEVVFSRSLVPRKTVREQARREAAACAAALAGWGDSAFLEAATLAQLWVRECLSALTALEEEVGAPDAIAVESFVDLPSRARRLLRGRWQTPLVIGFLASALADRGYTAASGRLVYQNPGLLAQYSYELGLLDRRRADGGRAADRVLPGDSLVRGEHEARALAHALALAHRLESLATDLPPTHD